MKIIRAKRRKNFTVMANDVIDDARLSYRALGLLTLLLSKPDGWETDSERLSDGRKEGRDALRTALSELESAGYLARRRVQDPVTGRWSTVAELTDRPDDGFPVVGVTSGNTTKPQVGPTTGKPTVGFPGATTKNGHQELRTPGHAAPGPLRPEHASRTRTDQADTLTAVPDLNDTQQVTSKTRARNNAVQSPILAVVDNELAEYAIDEYQLTLSVPLPVRPPLDPERENLWPVLAEQLTRINTSTRTPA